MLLRAEEIIVSIWKQRSDLRNTGTIPDSVILSRDQYRTIREYHVSLGTLENEEMDYLAEDRIFDLDILIDSDSKDGPRVMSSGS
ncbi:MAG: hypothetical protein K9L68_14140 [Spirochaetales bacterium]|nr:hypothetical protein [Spirochaetales bacterium]